MALCTHIYMSPVTFSRCFSMASTVVGVWNGSCAKRRLACLLCLDAGSVSPLYLEHWRTSRHSRSGGNFGVFVTHTTFAFASAIYQVTRHLITIVPK